MERLSLALQTFLSCVSFISLFEVTWRVSSVLSTFLPSFFIFFILMLEKYGVLSEVADDNTLVLTA